MDLGFLSPLFDRAGPWGSVYVDTSLATEDAATRQELEARATRDRLAQLGADEATGRAVHDELNALPRTAQPPGRAVFATDGEVVLAPALTVAPSRTQVSWSALPHIAPLVELSDGRPSCLVAYIDRTGADFELRGPLGTQSAGGVQGADWPVHRTASDDWSERHFQQTVENTWGRTATAIAEGLAACQAETRAEVVVLAGDPRERRAVHERLPSPLRETAQETAHGGRAPGAASQPLEEDIQRARAAKAQRHLTELMDRFQAGRMPDDMGQRTAAEGVPALLDAAREHRIAALLIRPDGPETGRAVWVGHNPDQLAEDRSEVQYLGDPWPVTARADDALMRSAAVTAAEVVPVRPAPGVPEGLPAGGLGALLRWPSERPS